MPPRPDIYRAWAKDMTRAEALKSATAALQNMQKTKATWIQLYGEESFRNAEAKLIQELQGLNLAETTDPLGGFAQDLAQASEVRVDPMMKFKVDLTDADQPRIGRREHAPRKGNGAR